MLFWSFVILFVLCFVAKWVIDKNYHERYYYDDRPDNRTAFQKWCTEARNSGGVCAAWGVVLVLTIVALVISLIGFAFDYPLAHSNKAALLEEQRILTYQIENKLYENDIEYGKNELFRDITEFNTLILKSRELAKDFWIGIYEPDIYDDIPLVELPVLEAS